MAIGASALCGIPCGVYTTHSADSECACEENSAPSPLMEREERFLGVACDRNGRVAKVMRTAEW